MILIKKQNLFEFYHCDLNKNKNSMQHKKQPFIQTTCLNFVSFDDEEFICLVPMAENKACLLAIVVIQIVREHNFLPVEI